MPTKKAKNARRNRLLMLIGIGLAGSVLVIFLGIAVIHTQRDVAAQAAIIGGVLTFLATSYTALYNEMSSYYKDLANNFEKKWNLIYPLVKEDYSPWIHSAENLRDYISNLSPARMRREEIVHILFIVALFFTYRLRFLSGDGGMIILGTTNKETEVNHKYSDILKNFDWAGDETSLRVSELQHLFISKDKKQDPYVQFRFVKDVEEADSLKKMRDELEQWLKVENNKQKVEKALTDFIDTFQKEIDSVYDAWQT